MNDLGPRLPLEVLDPESRDPGYWFRFRDRVLRLAAPELARRRARQRVTMSEVVLSWWRALVPAALATAMVAGVLILRAEQRPDPGLVGIEALLAGQSEGEPIPAVLIQDRLPDDGRGFLQAIEQH